MVKSASGMSPNTKMEKEMASMAAVRLLVESSSQVKHSGGKSNQ
jgi:hypothetical protein